LDTHKAPLELNVPLELASNTDHPEIMGLVLDKLQGMKEKPFSFKINNKVCKKARMAGNLKLLKWIYKKVVHCERTQLWEGDLKFLPKKNEIVDHIGNTFLEIEDSDER
jgi:hypothetical protein